MNKNKRRKAALKKSLIARGYEVPDDARFFADGVTEGMLIGVFSHSSHIDTIECYALLDEEGTLFRGNDVWFEEI